MSAGDRTVDAGLIVALSELAPCVSRGRTTQDVLRIAGEGLGKLGMRFLAFQIVGDDLVLRFLVTWPERHATGPRLIGRRLVGLRARLDLCESAQSILAQGKSVYRSDLDRFIRSFEAAAGREMHAPPHAGGSGGVVTPVFVRERPWGLLVMVSPTFRAEDAPAVGLFGVHVGSAVEVAELTQALDRAERDLAERDRLATIGEVAATLVHEVRNPLGVLFNSVASLRQLMRSEVDQEARSNAEELISIVGEETERLDAIVTDLLALARPTAIRTRTTALASVIRTITDAVPTLTKGATVELRLDLPSDLPSVEIDDRLVRQALLNVVLNALQAMPHGGTLTVATRLEERDDGTFACVDVTDTGSGISTENQSRMFEPFFTTKVTGTGLGLPLVKRIVEAHHGELGLVSGSSGTTFTVRLPLPVPGHSRITLKPEAAAPLRLRVAGTAR